MIYYGWMVVINDLKMYEKINTEEKMMEETKKNLRCDKCGKEVGIETKYCPECGAKMETHYEHQDKPEEIKHRSIASILGMIGTLIGFLGIFMPMMSAWGQKISFMGLLEESTDYGNFILCMVIAFAIVELVFFYLEHNGAGNGLAFAALVFFLYATFVVDTDGMSISDMLNYLDYGFWMICSGLVLMTISSVFNSKK